MLKVQKRDGSLQDFDRRKVIVGALKAGATNGEAEKLADEIESWLASASVYGVIKSQAIRTKGLQLLKTINPTVGASFEFYHKPS